MCLDDMSEYEKISSNIRRTVPTGSLGHGLSIGTGVALAGKVDNRKYKVYVLLSDGELNEGSVWEAMMFAGHHRLNNLIAFVDYNKMQALGCTRDIIDLEPLNEKRVFLLWKINFCGIIGLQMIENINLH